MKALPILLAAAAIIAPAAAGADSFGRINTQEISFAYVLPAGQADAGVLLADLTREARAACAIPGAPGAKTVDLACAAELVSKVVAEIDSAALDAAYDQSGIAALAPEPAPFGVVSR